MMLRILAGATLVLLLAPGAPAQEIHRWVDEKGKVHYGDKPPAQAKSTVVRERINSYSGPAEVRRVPASAKAAPAATGPVVMYATTWCGYCAKARAYFKQKGIAYVEHDVEKSATANAEFKRLGGRGVPLIVHGGQTLNGFSEQSFETLVARSAR